MAHQRAGCELRLRGGEKANKIGSPTELQGHGIQAAESLTGGEVEGVWQLFYEIARGACNPP